MHATLSGPAVVGGGITARDDTASGQSLLSRYRARRFLAGNRGSEGPGQPYRGAASTALVQQRALAGWASALRDGRERGAVGWKSKLRPLSTSRACSASHRAANASCRGAHASRSPANRSRSLAIASRSTANPIRTPEIASRSAENALHSAANASRSLAHRSSGRSGMQCSRRRPPSFWLTHAPERLHLTVRRCNRYIWKAHPDRTPPPGGDARP